MAEGAFDVRYRKDTGLTVRWAMSNGVTLNHTPVRVTIRGSNTYQAWTVINCGEDPPAWAEEDFVLTCFGDSAESPDVRHAIERIEAENGTVGYRAVATHERAKVILELRLEHGEVRVGLSIQNPQPLNGRRLPLCLVELAFRDLCFGPRAEYLGAHAYGGWTYHYGKFADLVAEGVPFQHGCVGLGIPVVCLHDPDNDRGMQLEFMLNGRPLMWLRPGSSLDRAHWCIDWFTDRLVEPGDAHAYGGTAGFAPYTGRPVAAMRRWRDNAATHYGLVPPKAPDWVRRANVIWFNMSPGGGNGFTRLDDPKCYEMLKEWKAMGYTAIYGVAPNRLGDHICAPHDYVACDEVGGLEAERQLLKWAHELGFHFFLWVTTVGITRYAPVAKEHPEWFTHRRNGDLYCAWASRPPDYQNCMPDGDPLSSGFRGWLKDQVTSLIERGYDGIYVDGMCMRGSNHLRWAWPGEARDAVEDQARELAEHVRSLKPDLITFLEDQALLSQVCAEVTQGRYNPIPPYLPSMPYLPKFGWHHGVIAGGPEVCAEEPECIPPEMARDYLLVRYASLLPGVVSEDCHGGYWQPEHRPWTVQSLMAGCMPRTGGEYVADPPRPKGEKAPAVDPAARRAASREMITLLRFCRDEALVREAPMSIEGVEVEGDAAVVGVLRPTAERALLAVIQFADRRAKVAVRLAEPADVPAVFRAAAGQPQRSRWSAREILRCMAEVRAAPPAQISGTLPMKVELAPYGFRIFELTQE